MSNASEPNEEEAIVEPSKYGKRLGWAVCLALILLAALVAVIQFGGDGNMTAPAAVQPQLAQPQSDPPPFSVPRQ